MWRISERLTRSRSGTATAGRRFARNSGFGTIAGVSTSLGSFLTTVIIAHLLGVTSTGIVAYGVWLAMVAASVIDFGAQASATRYLPELTATGRNEQVAPLIAYLFRRLAIAGPIAAAAFAANALRTRHGGGFGPGTHGIWLVIGGVCILQTFAAFTYGCFRGLQRFEWVAALTVLSIGLQLAAVAIGGAMFGVVGALGGYCMGSIVPALLCGVVIRRGGRIADDIRVRVRRFAFYYWAGSLTSSIVWSRMELFFLQHFSGSHPVGLFSVGLSLANIVGQGPLLLTAGLLPFFSECFGRHAVDEMRDALATAMRVLAFLVLPACFGLAAITPVVLPLIFGNAFAAAVPAATVLIVAAGLAAMAWPAAVVLYAVERSDFHFANGVAMAFLSIVFGVTLVPAFGLMGAVWGRAVVQVIAVATGSIFVVYRLHYPMPYRDLLRIAIAAVACAIVARGGLALQPGTVGLAAALVGGAATYVIAVRCLGGLPARDIARLYSLSGRLPAALRGLSDLTLRITFGPAAVQPGHGSAAL